MFRKINNKIAQSYENIDIINDKIKHISSLKKLVKQITKKNNLKKTL